MPTDQRVLGINIGRSVPPEPLARFPLAVCDRTSIDRGDLEYDLNPNAKPRPFNAHYGKPNDAQRWHPPARIPGEPRRAARHAGGPPALPAGTNAAPCSFASAFRRRRIHYSHPTDGELFCPTLCTAVPIPGSEGLQERESVEVRFFANLPLPE